MISLRVVAYTLYSLRLDPEMVRQIDALAKEDERSRNSMIRRLLAEALAAREAK